MPPSPTPHPSESIWSVLGSTQALSPYHWRVLCQWALVGLALLCFAMSVFSPAMIPNLGAWTHPNDPPLQGWLCLVMAVPFYPSNTLLACSPLWLALCRRAREPAPQIVLASLSVVSSGAVLFVGAGTSRLFVGYYLWATAHVLSSAALLIPVWLPRPSETAPPPDAAA